MIWYALVGRVRSRASLEAENLALRQQINVLRRKLPKRATFTNFDRAFFAWLYGLAPGVLGALAIVRPETVIRWHRAGFRSYLFPLLMMGREIPAVEYPNVFKRFLSA